MECNCSCTFFNRNCSLQYSVTEHVLKQAQLSLRDHMTMCHGRELITSKPVLALANLYRSTKFHHTVAMYEMHPSVLWCCWLVDYAPQIMKLTTSLLRVSTMMTMDDLYDPWIVFVISDPKTLLKFHWDYSQWRRQIQMGYKNRMWLTSWHSLKAIQNMDTVSYYKFYAVQWPWSHFSYLNRLTSLEVICNSAMWFSRLYKVPLQHYCNSIITIRTF